MARGVQFGELVLNLRAELRRSQSTAIGSEDLAPLKRTLNHVVAVVSNKEDWPFLYRKFDPIAIAPGDRFFDVPAGLNMERITGVRIKWGGSFYNMWRGITYDDYETWDPADDERSSPALKYDFQNIAGAEQIEIWPISEGTQSLLIEGYVTHPKLVNDTDLCLLDDEIILLFAAAELMGDEAKAEAQAKRDQANELLRLIKVRATRGDGAPVQMGLGSGRDRPESGRAVVRISGT